VELYEIPKAEFSIEDGCLTGSFQDNKFYVSDFRVVELSDRDGTPFVDINYLTVHKDSSEGRTNLFLLGGLADVSRYEQVVYYLNNITTHKSLDELEQSYLAFLKTVANKKQALMTELDTDGNGIIDIAENKDFSKLLAKRQMKILEFDKAEGKSYLHDFTKLSNYLKEKSSNVQELFSIIRENSNLSTRRYYDYVGVLRNQVHVYNLMALSAMNMIVSLAEDDRITFYEIYESFDKLNVFTSNHEREVSVRLKKIESKLDDVIQSIHEMEQNICSELITLQFISEDISDSLSGLSKGLREINSSLQVNNLLTGIQTYQMYKINKNTKPLN
jgi:hypothetical protein